MTPAKQLDGFLARYSADIAKQARAALAIMRKRLPGAQELVYDNYNALVIAFGPTERASDVWFSIALYPRWLTLFFLHGKGLPDPDERLEGSGSQVRGIRLDEGPPTLNQPAVRKLMAEALARARVPLDRKQKRRLIIKAISPKQRPRRPA